MAMATSFATTASPASVAKNINKPTSHSPLCYIHSHNHSHSKLSFRLSLKPRLRFFSKCLQRNRTPVIRERLDEVSVDGQSNASATSISKSDVLAVEVKNSKSSNEPSSADLTSEESISEFISQVANLVKLVDSRDIVELQLKQLDCELLIRKKLALPQQQPSAPVVMMQSPPQAAAPPAFQVFAPAAAPIPSAPASSQAPSPAPSSSASKSSLPPLKCPMAGMFYRSPAPSEPPFVKVGDKVQKGQVLCIIEAMKLMNEIEADQSGTIIEILAEDGKPVSADTPLFVIEP